MPLTFESQVVDKVAVIRCAGRISLGPEVQALEQEVDRHTRPDGAHHVNRVVLQLEQTDFLDSSGLGTLLRLYGVLRAAGGGLKLCQMSPRVLKVIEMTNLAAIFPAYASEGQAVAAFSAGAGSHGENLDSSKTRIVCVDTSKDLIAGLNALLTQAGYEVFTTRYLGDAVTLVKTMRPRVAIFGPGMTAVPNTAAVMENMRNSAGRPEVLVLPPDFYTAEAGQAGKDLVSELHQLVSS